MAPRTTRRLQGVRPGPPQPGTGTWPLKEEQPGAGALLHTAEGMAVQLWGLVGRANRALQEATQALQSVEEILNQSCGAQSCPGNDGEEQKALLPHPVEKSLGSDPAAIAVEKKALRNGICDNGVLAAPTYCPSSETLQCLPSQALQSSLPKAPQSSPKVRELIQNVEASFSRRTKKSTTEPAANRVHCDRAQAHLSAAQSPPWACQRQNLRPFALLLGDSITEDGYVVPESRGNNPGWVGLLENHYTRKVDILNRGYSGYNSTCALAMLPRILQDRALEEPLFFAVVMFGSNDASTEDCKQHVPLHQYTENLVEILRLLRQQGCKHSILCSPTPVSRNPSYWPNRSNTRLQRYMEAAKGVAERKEFCGEVRFVNVFNSMRKSRDFDVLFSDGLHLNAHGQHLLFNSLKLHLPKLLPSMDLPLWEEFLPVADSLRVADVAKVRASLTWHTNLSEICKLAAAEPLEKEPLQSPAAVAACTGPEPEPEGAAGCRVKEPLQSPAAVAACTGQEPEPGGAAGCRV